MVAKFTETWILSPFTDPVHTWTRDEVSSCDCSEKSYRHVNYRCLHCKAVSIERERPQVDIVFFVKKCHHPGRFERETLGRSAVNKVSLIWIP